MNTETNNMQDRADTITDDARSLVEATAGATEQKVVQARNRLRAALDAAKETCAAVQQKAVESAQAADQMIRDKPYHAIGVAFGIGAVVGFLLSRRNRQ